MDGVVDPSADVLWDSVAYIATTERIEDRRPRTDEEWKTVRNSALTLIEATNLLIMPGRRVAGPHKPADPPPGDGELNHDEIQQRIDSTHDSFNAFARGLQDAGLKALAAIDNRDPQGLMDAGGIIDEACEACHVTYWYPNARRGSGLLSVPRGPSAKSVLFAGAPQPEGSPPGASGTSMYLGR